MEETVFKKERLQIVEAVQKDIALKKNSKLVNATVDVLVEKEENGRCSGRTQNNQLVHFNGNQVIGKIVKVKIFEISRWSLKGVMSNSEELAVL